MAKSATQPQAPVEEWGDEIGSSALITWNEPRVLIGTLIDLVEVQGGKYGDKVKATLVQDDGATVATYPPSMLLARLQHDGTSTRSKAGRDVKNFSVRTARDAAADVFGKQELPV